MSENAVEVLLANALRELVTYVDTRGDDFTADDDVSALEGVAAVLLAAAPDDHDRLRTLLGPMMSFEMGLRTLTQEPSMA